MANLIYIGNVSETNTAQGVHAQNMARLFSRIGYETTFLCSGECNEGALKQQKDGFTYYLTPRLIRNPLLVKLERLVDDLTGWKEMRLLKKLYPEIKPEVIVLYDYVAEKSLIRFCRRHHIFLAAERVDWFEKSDYVTVRQRWIFQPRADRYINRVDRNLGGIIAISPYFAAHYRKLGVDVIHVPPIFEAAPEGVVTRKRNDRRLHLVYAGSMGEKKDKILPVLASLRRINGAEIRVTLDLVGIDMETLAQTTGQDDWERLGVAAHGYCAHEKAREIVSQADFSLLLRENKRYAKAGFSTKFAESMLLGVPVICTKAGGADQVITHMCDGVHLTDNEEQTVQEALLTLLQLPEEKILDMKRRAHEKACDVFSVSTYEKPMKAFLEAGCRKADLL